MIAQTSSSVDVDVAPPVALLELLRSEAGQEVVKTTVMLMLGPVTGERGPLQGLLRLVQQRVRGVRGEERMHFTFSSEVTV